MSGGIVVAIAAVLWLIYLVPTWRRRSEYLATERNAVRLQQTMRVLAETADVPEPVRVEISAREVADKQRVLRRVQAEAREHARAEALQEAAVLRAKLTAAPAPTGQRLRARRRARGLASLTLLIGLTSLAVGLIAGGLPVLSIVGGVAAAAGLGLIVALARPVRMVPVPASLGAQAPAAAAPRAEEPLAAPAETGFSYPETGWVPQPTPKPLYQSPGTAAAAAMAQVDAQDALRRAALAQILAERSEQLAPPAPVRFAPRPQEAPAAPPSRFARMGVVEGLDAGLEAVDLIARRRSAG